LAVSFGGGTNSTAMLCGFLERDIQPDFISFADTGGELTGTYDHVDEMDAKCREWWGVGIDRVHKTYRGEFEGLERNSLRKSMLPGLAYGNKSCSMKYKVEPQDKALKAAMDKAGKLHAIRAIGYDAGERHRVNVERPPVNLRKGRTVEFWYPLVEWQWRRQDCVVAIQRHGITPPGKSACFFCPAMKRGEILRLKQDHPELYQRALTLEATALSTSPERGLGGSNRKWSDIEKEDNAQMKLWDIIEPFHEPCGCYDG
jgi:hypothetical protein